MSRPDYTSKAPYAEGQKWAKFDKKRHRVFTIMSQLVHPDTGEILFTRESIDEISKHRSTRGVVASSWIIHDKDEAEDGGLKKPHFHAVEIRTSGATIGQVARAWNLPPNYIEIPSGDRSFAQCCLYLTHEGAKQVEQGKHVYNRSEVVSYGHDFDITVDTPLTNRQVSGVSDSSSSRKSRVTAADAMAMAVMAGEMTLEQAKREDPLTYSRNISRLRTARQEFLRTAPPPDRRMNFLISGEPGAGKTSFASLFAQFLAAEYYPDLAEVDAIHWGTSPEVALQNYQGQPIFIWDDFRPHSLIKAVSPGMDRETAFSAFDPVPRVGEYNVKYGSVVLRNTINIVTTVLPYEDFMNGLAGRYQRRDGSWSDAENADQSFRRFPFFVQLTPHDITFLANAGFFSDTREYRGMETLGRVVADMKTISEAMGGRTADEKSDYIKIVGDRILAPILSPCRAALAPASNPDDMATVTDNILADIAVLDHLDPDQLTFETVLRQMQDASAQILAHTEEIAKVFRGYGQWAKSNTGQHHSGALTSRDRTTVTSATREIKVLVDRHHALGRALMSTQFFQKVFYQLAFGIMASECQAGKTGVVSIEWSSTDGIRVKDGEGISGLALDTSLFDRELGLYQGYSALWQSQIDSHFLESCHLRAARHEMQKLPKDYRVSLTRGEVVFPEVSNSGFALAMKGVA